MEEYDDTYWSTFRAFEKEARDTLTGGRRHLFEAGLKGLDKLPKPSGKGFKGTYFTNIILNVPASMVPKERDFYRDLLGMKVAGENRAERIERRLLAVLESPDGEACSATKLPATVAFGMEAR